MTVRAQLNDWEVYEMLRIRRADGSVLSPNGVEKAGVVRAQVAKAGEVVRAQDPDAGGRDRRAEVIERHELNARNNRILELEGQLKASREETAKWKGETLRLEVEIDRLRTELRKVHEAEAAERERNRQRMARARRR